MTITRKKAKSKARSSSNTRARTNTKQAMSADAKRAAMERWLITVKLPKSLAQTMISKYGAQAYQILYDCMRRPFVLKDIINKNPQLSRAEFRTSRGCINYFINNNLSEADISAIFPNSGEKARDVQIQTSTPLPQTATTINISKRQEALVERTDDDIKQKRLEKLRATESTCFQVIGRYEGIKWSANPDPKAGGYDIAFGNRTRPDGTPVQPTDKITSSEQLYEYYHVHSEQRIYDKIADQLHVENMTTEQIVAVESLMYNCGENILNNNPILVENLNKYFDTKDPVAFIYIADFFNKRIKAKDPKTGELKTVPSLILRRNSEIRLMSGDISITDPTHPNYVDAEKIAMGSLYCLSKKNLTEKEALDRIKIDSTTYASKINAFPGPTLDQECQNPPAPKKPRQQKGKQQPRVKRRLTQTYGRN